MFCEIAIRNGCPLPSYGQSRSLRAARLQAAKQLGWTNINAVILSNISDVDELEMELEENNQRKEFTDQELLEGYRRLEKLRNPGFWRRLWKLIQKLFSGLKNGHGVSAFSSVFGFFNFAKIKSHLDILL